MPPYYGPILLPTYDIHNKISLWDHSEAIGFWPYVLAFEATVPLILWSKCLNFFVPKDFHTCQHDPTKCRSRSINAFFLQSTLIWHIKYYVRKRFDWAIIWQSDLHLLHIRFKNKARNIVPIKKHSWSVLLNLNMATLITNRILIL